uniref:Membrane protein BRI3 n=1 Tax=Plectus sambesii TaxID=2011161 RepID=A0A914XQH6_9BILA
MIKGRPTTNAPPPAMEPPPPYQNDNAQQPLITGDSLPPPVHYQQPYAPPPQPHQNFVPPAYGSVNCTVVNQPAAAPAPPSIVNISNSNSIPYGNCPFCRTGIMVRRRNCCCMMVLIVLVIFTFPFGLLLFCCFPCAWDDRCTHCNRSL